MSTLLTNAANDLYLNNTGSLAFADDGKEATAQIIKNVLLTQKGELPLDVEAGIPYLETVLGDNPNVPLWEGYMIERAESVANVQRVEQMQSKAANNVLSYEMTILTDYGTVTAEG